MADWVGASSEELTAAYARQDVSPVTVAEALFDHAARRDVALGAVRVLSREAALESAAASERRWRRHAPQSPLDGVPVMLREDIAVPSYANEVEGVSPVVARLLEAGCIILGKTVMAAHDSLVAGRCIEGRLVQNPWQPALTSGGSSCGAAVACAAGYAPLHIGIDRIGSARLPAAFCGVFGFKPTQGRVPLGKPSTGRVAAPITRSVHDAAALMNILVRPDDRDFTSLPPESLEYRMRVDGLSPKSLSVAVLTDMGLGPAVDPVIRQTVQEAARLLQMAGASVEMIDSFLAPEMFESVQILLEADAHLDLQAMSEQERMRLPSFVTDWAGQRADAGGHQRGHDGLRLSADAGVARHAVGGHVAVARQRPGRGAAARGVHGPVELRRASGGVAELASWGRRGTHRAAGGGAPLRRSGCAAPVAHAGDHAARAGRVAAVTKRR